MEHQKLWICWRHITPLPVFNTRRRHLAHSRHLPSSRRSSPRQRGGSSAAPTAPKIPPTSRPPQLRAWVVRRAGSRWVLAVARADPIRPLFRRRRHWSGASPSRGGLEGNASAVSSAATKLLRVRSHFVASVAVVRVTGSVTAIVVIDLQSAALLHLEAAIQLFVLLALHTL
jgi:hypothetical protein